MKQSIVKETFKKFTMFLESQQKSLYIGTSNEWIIYIEIEYGFN